MKIKKLEIYGFKTFPQPTELLFHDGVTSIVGPNGCGKSNIIDAIRWVMGEKSPKGLRGDSMSDVIFNGCDTRKALNFAEVTLTLGEVEGKLPEKFGNYHEIAVTRRLHRSGESEYLINKIACRLKDISDLFLDTGLGRRAYSIVEQGRIDAILSAKPVDRRFLIEEAAGLSKYRARREESLVKMKQTGENLERLNDILSEVKREMESLKRQASRAKAFKALRSERRELERNVLVSAWNALAEKLALAAQAYETAREELVSARAASDTLGADLQKHRIELLEEEKALEESTRRAYGFKNQIAERESRGLFLEREAEGLAHRAVRAEEEAAELDARAESIGGELAELAQEIETLGLRIDDEAAQAEALAEAHQKSVEERRLAESRLTECRNGVFRNVSELSRVQNSIEHALRMEKEATRRAEALERQEEEIVEKLGEVDAETQSREHALRSAEAARDQAVEERGGLEEDLEDLAFERDALAKRVETLRGRLQTDQSRLKGLTSLKDSMEGYGSGVKEILRHAQAQSWVGVRGVVADALSVPSRYEAALEAALGERLQYVVVADAPQALEGVAHLKDSKAGRGSFIPVDLKEPAAVVMPDVREPWAFGPLLSLVEVRPGNDRLARALLGGIYVVETLDRALELRGRGHPALTFVTLDGDTVTPEGVITGGASTGADSGLLRHNREIRELTDAVAAHSVELSEVEEEFAAVRARHAEAQKRLEFLRDEVHRQELKVANVSRDMAQFLERRERLEERREAVSLERDGLAAEMRRVEKQLADLDGEKRGLIQAKEDSEARMEELEAAFRAASAKAEENQAEWNRLKIQAAADRQRKEGLAQQVRSLTQSREATSGRAQRLRAEARDLMAQRSARTEERARIALELETLTVELRRQEEADTALRQQLDERRHAVTLREKDSGEARRRADELTERVSHAERTLREQEMEGRLLAERYAERVEGDIAEAAREGLPGEFDPSQAATRIAALDDRIRAFGEINLLADEEYEQRKARFEFLETQKADLEESLESLRNAIQRINRISRERFAETFEQVNAKFMEVYPSLFRGGEAKLFLTDPENLLETGIDIVAQPPGKRPQHISLLSGGEKALTAVALIFSLFLVKPSPFCVLDEVDAPLDDANVERFTELLAQMATTSQFLVITHNKITMEAANHLYGVTMENPGISNLVSVRLNAPVTEVAAA